MIGLHIVIVIVIDTCTYLSEVPIPRLNAIQGSNVVVQVRHNEVPGRDSPVIVKTAVDVNANR